MCKSLQLQDQLVDQDAHIADTLKEALSTNTRRSSRARTLGRSKAGPSRDIQAHPLVANCGFVTPSGPGAVIWSASTPLLLSSRGYADPGAADLPGAPL